MFRPSAHYRLLQRQKRCFAIVHSTDVLFFFRQKILLRGISESNVLRAWTRDTPRQNSRCGQGSVNTTSRLSDLSTYSDRRDAKHRRRNARRGLLLSSRGILLYRCCKSAARDLRRLTELYRYSKRPAHERANVPPVQRNAISAQHCRRDSFPGRMSVSLTGPLQYRCLPKCQGRVHGPLYRPERHGVDLLKKQTPAATSLSVRQRHSPASTLPVRIGRVHH